MSVPTASAKVGRGETFFSRMGEKSSSMLTSKRKQVQPTINPSNNVILALTYGVINAVLTIPCMYGYCYIIFGNQVYTPYLAALSKLVLFSSAVHQMTFSLLSTLPFAIGQVQDAGLIFMSQMTASVAYRLAGKPDDVILATAVATTAICTTALGLCVVLVGRAKLARFVSYLPMPVIGGYLAYIGWFCLQAGLSLCTGLDFSSIGDFVQLADLRTLLLALPGALCGLLLFWVGRKFTHFAVLPCVMLAIPVIFYVALGLSEYNLQDARNAGLVGQADSAAKWSEAFSFYKFELVEWWVLPYQIPVFLGMVVVVAFSSSLDVAAIEMDMGTPLDTNSELVTVGWSNVVSGSLGGFTGSYIFSQTVFTYRTKCWSRLVGWVVCLSELTVFLLRVDPLSFVPLAFFAAMLIFIAWDLMFEWLFEVHHKLLRFESFTLFVTFASIQALGLDLGLVVGILVAGAGFVVSYASQSVYTMQRVSKQSRVLRPAVERRTLQLYREKILCLELRGELFFGSAAGVLKQVKAFLNESNGDLDASQPNTDALSSSPEGFSPSDPEEASPLVGEGLKSATTMYDGSSADGKGSVNVQVPKHDSVVNRGEQVAPHLSMPSLVVFDCNHLRKIDASAARALFLPLQKISERDEICVAYAGLDPAQEMLLKAHGALDGENVAVFAQLDSALGWCERTLILAAKSDGGGSHLGGGFSKLAHFQRRKSLTMSFYGTLSDLLRQMLELPLTDELTETHLTEFCAERHFETGNSVFTLEEPSRSLYILLQGRVSLVAANVDQQVTLRAGGIFGYADMFLENSRTFSAVAATDCIVAEFTMDALDRMLLEQPRLLCLLQRAILQFSSLELQNEPV